MKLASILENTDEYAGLEDADEFGGGCHTCDNPDDWIWCEECGLQICPNCSALPANQGWVFIPRSWWNTGSEAGIDTAFCPEHATGPHLNDVCSIARSGLDKQGRTWGQVIADHGLRPMDYLQQLEDWVLPVWAMRDDLTEDVDEYGGLEDADEFEEDEQYAYCSNCDVEYIAATADLELCENCGSAWCERCMPGGSIWQDSDKEEKLRFQVATDPTEPPIDHNVSFNRFWDVYEMLLKCPHCSGPARNALPFRD